MHSIVWISIIVDFCQEVQFSVLWLHATKCVLPELVCTSCVLSVSGTVPGPPAPRLRLLHCKAVWDLTWVYDSDSFPLCHLSNPDHIGQAKAFDSRMLLGPFVRNCKRLHRTHRELSCLLGKLYLRPNYPVESVSP